MAYNGNNHREITMASASTVKYLSETYPGQFKVEKSEFKGHPWSGRDASGYGRKIPTDWMVALNGRRYRVYVCQFSNAGTAYINTKDHKFLVVLDSDIPE